MTSTNDFQKVLVAWGRRAQHHNVDYHILAMQIKRNSLSIKTKDENLVKQEALRIVAGNEYTRLFGTKNADLRNAYSHIVGKAIFLVSYGGASMEDLSSLLTRLCSEYGEEFKSYAGNFLLMNLAERMSDFVRYMTTRRIIDQRTVGRKAI